jgi:hypothetical protein
MHLQQFAAEHVLHTRHLAAIITTPNTCGHHCCRPAHAGRLHTRCRGRPPRRSSVPRACAPSARQPASHPWWVPACHTSLDQSAAPSTHEDSLPCLSHGGFCLGGDPGLTETVQATRILLCEGHLPGLQGTTRSTTVLARQMLRCEGSVQNVHRCCRSALSWSCRASRSTTITYGRQPTRRGPTAPPSCRGTAGRRSQRCCRALGWLAGSSWRYRVHPVAVSQWRACFSSLLKGTKEPHVEAG